MYIKHRLYIKKFFFLLFNNKTYKDRKEKENNQTKNISKKRRDFLLSLRLVSFV